jgi:hypothetical protein
MRICPAADVHSRNAEGTSPTLVAGRGLWQFSCRYLLKHIATLAQARLKQRLAARIIGNNVDVVGASKHENAKWR